MAPLTEAQKAESLPRQSGAASLLDGHYAPPPADQDGKLWVRTSAIVQADAQKLYGMWRDMEAAPAWHERLIEVRKIGPDNYHWIMRDEPGDNLLEWDLEILADEPGRRIAWRSIQGAPCSAGEVIFEPAPGARGTMITVLEQYGMGKAARTWEAIAGRGPRQSAIENLRHFKALAETGEIPRLEPQPHGDRGFIGKSKRSLYGETIQTPQGTAASNTASEVEPLGRAS